MMWDTMTKEQRIEEVEVARSKSRSLARFTADELIAYRDLQDRRDKIERECRDLRTAMEQAQEDLESVEDDRDRMQERIDAHVRAIERAATEREAQRIRDEIEQIRDEIEKDLANTQEEFG